MNGNEVNKDQVIIGLALTCVSLWARNKLLKHNMEKLRTASMELAEVALIHAEASDWLIDALNNDTHTVDEINDGWNERMTFLNQAAKFHED